MNAIELGSFRSMDDFRLCEFGNSKGRAALLRRGREVLDGHGDKFIEMVRGLERVDFPEFRASAVYLPTSTSEYFLFSPSWYFRHRLLTENIVADIKMGNRQILSVGSGPAYLERFLVERLGICADQITLSDKEPISQNGFNAFTFDMYGAWPYFGRNFDYILFPQSTFLSLNFHENAERQAHLHNLIENSLEWITEAGQVRICGEPNTQNIFAVKERLEAGHPDLEISCDDDLITCSRKTG
jgi:hypothetical protein